MVLQVFAHARQMVHHVQAVLAQQIFRPDPRELQELRRLNGSSRQDHLPSCLHHAHLSILHKLYARGTSPLPLQTGGLRAGDHRQVGAPTRRLEVALRSAPAPTAPGVELKITCSLLGGAIEVFISRHTQRVGTLNEGLNQRVRLTNIGHPQGAAVSMKLAGAALVVLRTDEIGQHLIKAPTRVTKCRPVVVVFTLTPDINQPIDRTRPPQSFASRPINLALIHVGVWVGLELPVHEFVPHGFAVANGQMNPERPIFATRLQQTHPHLRVFRQSVG